jgi:hypothetical protein
MEVPRKARSYLPWLSQVRRTLNEQRIELPAANEPPLNRTIALIRTHRDWHSSGAGGTIIRIIHAIYHPPASLSYLQHEPAPAQRHRARLRFNASNLNQPLHRRCARLAPSPGCVHCLLQLGRTTPETVPHVLLVCPLYANARDVFIHRVDQCIRRPYHLTVQLILDPLTFPGLQQNTRIELLHITSDFISEVHRLRDF